MIKSGDIMFTIDQQRICTATWRSTRSVEKKNCNILGANESIPTGPPVIDQSNVDAVQKYAEAGGRRPGELTDDPAGCERSIGRICQLIIEDCWRRQCRPRLAPSLARQRRTGPEVGRLYLSETIAGSASPARSAG